MMDESKRAWENRFDAVKYDWPARRAAEGHLGLDIARARRGIIESGAAKAACCQLDENLGLLEVNVTCRSGSLVCTKCGTRHRFMEAEPGRIGLRM